MYNLQRMKELRDKVAVVGVGDTDYGKDYRSQGATIQRGAGAPYDAYDLGIKAFRRALDDSGLKKEDIDGVITSGDLDNERFCEIVGINPRWVADESAPRAVALATIAIATGQVDTLLLVKSTLQRSAGRSFGGPRSEGRLAYSYFAPWGMTSPGSLYAMMFKRHQMVYGTTSEQLAAIPVALRKAALLNENAVMHAPLTKEDYLESRYIVEPLHLYDYCIINDGGVALILTRDDNAKNLRKPPVYISGMGRYDLSIDTTQLRPRMEDFYYPAHREVAKQVYAMAGVGQKDIDSFHNYDSFSVHLFFPLEGFGFCKEGEAGEFIQDGRIELEGELPCNTSGGMLSESYMQGWNHQVEIVRQLRGEAGKRQLKKADYIQYVQDSGGNCISIIYRKA